MVILRFPDEASKQRALGYLPGRFPFTPTQLNEVLVPTDALAALANERIPYSVEYEPEFISREEAIAMHDRGESLDPVEAFAKIAGVSPDEMLRRLEAHKAKYYEGQGR